MSKLNLKIVYCGCARSGKTATIEALKRNFPAESCSRLMRLSTEGDIKQEFESVIVDTEDANLHLFTSPGGMFFNRARIRILSGADGVVFVAHSGRDRYEENRDAMHLLIENINMLKIPKMPMVIQWNQQDNENIMSIAELQHLNLAKADSFKTIANQGVGVFPALKRLVAILLENRIVDADTIMKKTEVKPSKFMGRADYYKDMKCEK